MNKNPSLFSDVARKCSSRMVFYSVEGKKKLRRKRNYSQSLMVKKDYKFVKTWRKKRKKKGKRNLLPQGWDVRRSKRQEEKEGKEDKIKEKREREKDKEMVKIKKDEKKGKRREFVKAWKRKENKRKVKWKKRRKGKRRVKWITFYMLFLLSLSSLEGRMSRSLPLRGEK